MNTQQIIAAIKELHAAKGWNAVHAFLRKNNIAHKITGVDFGLHTSKKTFEEKEEWLHSAAYNEFRAHYYSRAVKARRNGYGYNVVRGQQITLL